MKKAIRKVLSIKSKSSPERHHNYGYELQLLQPLANSLGFSADVIDKILDMGQSDDQILTFSWKPLEKSTLYIDCLAAGEQNPGHEAARQHGQRLHLPKPDACNLQLARRIESLLGTSLT